MIGFTSPSLIAGPHLDRPTTQIKTRSSLPSINIFIFIHTRKTIKSTPERVDDGDEMELHRIYGWKPWWILLALFLAAHLREWGTDTEMHVFHDAAYGSYTVIIRESIRPTICYTSQDFTRHQNSKALRLRDYRVFNTLHSPKIEICRLLAYNFLFFLEASHNKLRLFSVNF